MTPATTAQVDPSDLTRRARLSSDESQQAFRALLDALARPGRVVALPTSLTDRMPPAIVPAAALADVEVAVAVLSGPDDSWADAVLHATGARATPPALAQMVVCRRAPAPAELAVLERGDAASPERGTRVSIACRSLRAPEGGRAAGSGLALTLRGPGVEGTAHVVVDGLHPDVLQALVDANRSFPAGIDTWLVADDGSVVGLPRSTSVTTRPEHDLDAAPHPNRDHQGAR
ncbi:phosphonate C-P lyase system protein PhnH [soil metagenome]